MPAALLPDECRVLGVLIEKAQTTPAQYPLTLNGVVAGCNQRNNRDPVVAMDEERALAALDGLRAKGLAREVSLEGSRVPKYRHVAREGLQVETAELVTLAELLLRGPQTVGELRSRASRMHPLESMEVVENVLSSLASREPPLVEELPPAPGSRAPRWRQMLCPDLHPLDHRPAPSLAGPAAEAPGELEELRERLERLEAGMAAVRRALAELGANVE